MSSVPTNSDLEDQLRRNATEPAEASNETGSVKQHPLRDQIELDKHLARKASAKSPLQCLGITRIVAGKAAP